MKLHGYLADSIRRSAAEVFSAMLGVEMEDGGAWVEAVSQDAQDGVVSFVGLAGLWTGAGSMACSGNLACQVCGRMLLTETPAVNPEVLDVIAELTSMIVGNVKTGLEEETGALGLSIPTVVFGKNFRTRTVGGGDWTAVRFTWMDEPLTIRMRLAPADGGPPVSQAGEPCTLDI